MNRTEWVLIDTETTGLRTDDWVIEVCIQQMQGWRPVGASKSWLINAPKSVGRGAFGVHGISDAMLARHGEDPRKAHDAIIDYIDGRPFGAFNLSFDRRMLNADWDRLRVAKNKRPIDALCALRLARLFIPDSSGYRLAHLADHLKLKCKPKHRAKHDVKATAEMLSRCVSVMAGNRTFKEIRLLCEMPICRARAILAD